MVSPPVLSVRPVPSTGPSRAAGCCCGDSGLSHLPLSLPPFTSLALIHSLSLDSLSLILFFSLSLFLSFSHSRSLSLSQPGGEVLLRARGQEDGWAGSAAALRDGWLADVVVAAAACRRLWTEPYLPDDDGDAAAGR